MFRFFLHAVPLIILLLFLFSLTISFLESGPATSLTVLSLKSAPFRLVMATWLLEAFGLVALYLLIEGRGRLWWLDGLLAGWVAWIFRGPLLVVTVVVAAGRSQAPWFRLAMGWWVLYSVCGLVMALLARRHSAKARAAAILSKTPAAPELEPAKPEPAPVDSPAENSRSDYEAKPADDSEPGEPETPSVQLEEN